MRNARFTPIALAVLLTACASKPQGTPDNEPTLATLATRTVPAPPTARADAVVAVSPEQAAAAYKRFLDVAPRASTRWPNSSTPRCHG